MKVRLMLSVMLLADCCAYAQSPNGNMEIADPTLVVISGIVVPAHAVSVNGVVHNAPPTCRFKFHAPPGLNSHAWRQATDAIFHGGGKTCEAAFYHGQLSQEFLQANPQAQGSFAGTPGQAVALPGAVEKTAAPVLADCCVANCGGQYSCRVRWTSAYLDPVNIETTHLGSEMTWVFYQFNTDGLCCYAKYTAGGPDPYALTQTGNQLVQTWNTYGINTDSTYSYVGYTSSALFINQHFPGCTPTQPMYYHYDPVEVDGYGDGTFDGYDNSWLDGDGGCRVLLHHLVYYTVVAHD
ncbi:MAG TPA: hypothetical protein VKX45_15945 [Bryobacteraceae bacterium]|jgi:hypothetical protein|nr:hypothetical protein [Bryobacteraceae bacterium]